ncbi:hypothetical protein Ahy_Scaffold1g106600 isoform A [Arachis hypogaea]|uniref:Uncharacterized protein n=1 Tax=Arachis hypogaea TaxID=3818 RepID=A0A444WQQ1_ARAHY|nr:hypothetical protein Ahy_Scaffold1g106600 isoform A [Arachis hypogaea]
MPRSRINGNFIDKTFFIVANILLRIIPTISREKEAFTYYRDGEEEVEQQQKKKLTLNLSSTVAPRILGPATTQVQVHPLSSIYNVTLINIIRGVLRDH